MNTAPAKVYEVVTPVVAGLGYELVGIHWLPQGKHSLLRIYIDHPDGIQLQDCEQVSHQLSAVLDVEDVVHGQYMLEVSSPGLDRPLFTLEQFQRFTGQMVKIECVAPVMGHKRFKGSIEGIEEDVVCLRSESDGELVEIPFSVMKKANLVPDL